MRRSLTDDAVYTCVKVAMGQGQAEVAMQLLQECATNGEWLCLKNLHLVTAWLPTLEKVGRQYLFSWDADSTVMRMMVLIRWQCVAVWQ